MECPLGDPILFFNENTLNVVRKLYDLDKPGAMEQAIDSLEQWIEKQNHFTVKKFDRNYLERAIIMSKGSLERTKERLDKLLTMRTLMPKFFGNHDVIKDYKKKQGIIAHIALPEMTEDYDRIYICRVRGKNFSAKLYLEGYRYTFMEGNGLKLKGIFIITDSKLIETVITIAKSCLSEKNCKRIKCLKSRKELLDHLPKKVIPKDYGGDSGKTLDEIDDAWLEILGSEEFTKYYQNMLAARTDESLRNKEKFNEEYLGLPGSFRILSVD